MNEKKDENFSSRIFFKASAKANAKHLRVGKFSSSLLSLPTVCDRWWFTFSIKSRFHPATTTENSSLLLKNLEKKKYDKKAQKFCTIWVRREKTECKICYFLRSIHSLSTLFSGSSTFSWFEDVWTPTYARRQQQQLTDEKRNKMYSHFSLKMKKNREY